MEVRTRKISRVPLDGKATDEAARHQEVEGGDDPQHTRYIMWTGQDVDENQISILQPVSGSWERKMKGKAKTRSGREREVNKPDGAQIDCATRSRVKSRSAAQT